MLIGKRACNLVGFFTIVLAGIAVAADVAAQQTADAEAMSGAPHSGLLRGRDLTPFGFLRLDMRPAHAVTLKPGEWAVEVTLGYQNTWALSPNVETYLNALPGRRRLGAAEVQAIRDLPGENYLVDIELGLIDFGFHRKLDEHWSAFGIVGAVAYGGGFLDGLIENFHDAFGFDDYGRPAVQRNAVNVIYDLDRIQYFRQGTPRRGGVLDPTFGVRYALSARPVPWNLILEGAVKVPLGGKRELLSNGHADVGLQATAQHVSGRHGTYASVSAVLTQGSLFGAATQRQWLPTALVGHEYAWSSRTTLVGQASASRSALTRADTGLDGLRDVKYQYALGVRHRIGRSTVTVAFTENVKNVNNTPDFGLQLGWVYWP